ncbi:formylglycine-generating enzyme family protein [uncultured Proteiniphilum sp.]|uniref:formylglycine-generating enzyme family protein n=1 Tax=uncultured Proteiniphilum sp. TaxID=497637 RepID=UPI0026229E35|nr:formylglycine-generating enzyme family protein [uncultured Proteiniphilum sp.]
MTENDTTFLLVLITFVLIFGITTACIQDKSDQELIQGPTFTVNGESFEMVFVEGGTFTMGCTAEQGGDCEDDEKPAHEETLPTFYMGKYEVTQKLWRAVMGSDLNRSYNSGCEDCPAEHVSWNDAQEFISKLNILTDRNFRLPTEAEWEYAARGGKRSKGYKYSGSNKIDEVAWYIDNYQKSKYGNKETTHPAGMKKPNELGLYDMSGNVWEWCSDWYTKEYYRNGKSVHPGWPYPGTTLLFRRVLRGGSWGGNAKGCRVSYIDYDVENHRDEYGGFRLALDSDSMQVVTN